MHGCQSAVELGQEPPAKLRCLACSRDDLDDRACERRRPPVGIGKGLRIVVKWALGCASDSVSVVERLVATPA